MKPSTLSTLRALAFSTPQACLRCRYRCLRSSAPPAAPESKKIPPKPNSAPAPQPFQSTRRDEEFVPKPLGRPIGFHNPPKPGENSGVDKRSLRQRRDDFVNWDKHLERRKKLMNKVSKPYFRDFSNMRFHKGKIFLANPKLFRAEYALYFPNLQGTTLKRDQKIVDSTDLLKGKVSVVTVFSSRWAENQKDTFQSPALQEILNSHKDVAQKVETNVEENKLKAGVQWIFLWYMRRQRPKSEHGRYMRVTRGVSDEIKEAIGMMNSRIGYVYLLDRDCRIRWAASGAAEGEEKQYLVQGLKRLIEEAKSFDKAEPESVVKSASGKK